MNWLFDIFSDKSDQAKLIAIFISAVIAILIVLLNQWFLLRRSKRDLLIEKIEALFSSSNEYISSCRALMDSLHEHELDISSTNTSYEFPKEIVNNLNDSITKMQMICGLYFQDEKFSPDDYSIRKMPMLEAAYKGEVISESEGFNAIGASVEHIQSSRKNLDDLCKRLMKKHGH